MDKERYIVAAGEIVVDNFAGKLCPGGAPANFAWHARIFGRKSLMISAVGNDHLGDLIRRHCAGGPEIMLQQSSYPTGEVLVSCSGSQASNRILEDRAWDHLEMLPETAEVLRNAMVFSFGTLIARSPCSRSFLKKAWELLPADCMRFCDLNFREHFYSRELLEEIFAASRLVKLNDAELDVLVQLFGIPAGSSELRLTWLKERFRLQGIILTMGERGSLVIENGEVSALPALEAAVRDTVGAGDAFGAVYAASRLEGFSPYESHILARFHARRVVENPGAWLPAGISWLLDRKKAGEIISRAMNGVPS